MASKTETSNADLDAQIAQLKGDIADLASALKELKVDPKVNQARESAQNFASSASEQARHAREYASAQAEHAGEFVGERPFTSVGFAFAAGLAVGLLLKR
jgi:ElaB/YqjD/DUF883 family membrane-anchored ribosome-binding protein